MPTPSRWSRLLDAVRSSFSGPLKSSSPELARLWGQPSASSGVVVTEHTALNYSAVWAATSLISSQVASLPLILYKRLPNGGKERFTGHPLYRLLHDEPNTEMTSMVFRETLQAHVLTWGNAYAEIERDASGRPVNLWPLAPDRVDPYREGGVLRYRVRGSGGQDVDFAAIDILHIPGLGYDGTCGYSVVAKARESFGLGLATERFGGSFFGNGSTFGGLITHPKTLQDKGRENLRKSLEARHQGVDRAHKLLLLEEGMTYTQLGIPPSDAQFLETRKFQITDVARWFNIPPHKLRDLDRATFSNIEQQSIEFVTDTLRPWMIRWEQEINRKLISKPERNQQFAEHLVDGLLRGDVASRYAAYAVGRQWGWLSADDIRVTENLNPLPNETGAIYLVPMNMTPASRINEVIDAQIAPKPAPDTASVRAELATELAEARAEAARHLARALALDEEIAAATGDAVAQRAEAEQAWAGMAEANTRADVASAKLLLVTEQIDKANAERDAWGEKATEQAKAAGEQEQRAIAADLALAKQAADASVAEALREVEFRAKLDAAVAQAVECAEAFAADEIGARDSALQALRDELAAEKQAAADQIAEAVRKAADAHLAAIEKSDALSAAEDKLFSLPEMQTRAETAEQQLTEQHEIVRAALADVASKDAELVKAQHDRDAALAFAEALEKAQADTTARLATVESALSAQRSSEMDRLAGVIAAHRELVVDAMGRMTRRETAQARRHQATPQKLRSWLAGFDTLHADLCVEAMLPAVRAILAWKGSPDDPTDTTIALVTAHLAELRKQIGAVLDADPDDFHAALEKVLTRWENDRAGRVADALMADQIAYLRTESR